MIIDLVDEAEITLVDTMPADEAPFRELGAQILGRTRDSLDKSNPSTAQANLQQHANCGTDLAQKS